MKSCFQNIQVGDILCISMLDRWFNLAGDKESPTNTNLYPVIGLEEGLPVVMSASIANRPFCIVEGSFSAIIRIKKSK